MSCIKSLFNYNYSVAGFTVKSIFGLLCFNGAPKFSLSSLISVAPCRGRLTPRGNPRQDDKLIELIAGQLMSISFTASTDTDEPHKFKWLLEKLYYFPKSVSFYFIINFWMIYLKGDSSPFSASAFNALSSGSVAFAQAKSNSVKLCAYFEATNSSPELRSLKFFIWKSFCKKQRHITQYLALQNIQTKISVSGPKSVIW